MGRWRVLVAVTIFAWWGLIAPASAQPQRLPAELVNASTDLDNAQRKTLDEYVQGWIERLASGNDQEVATARDRLIDPFTNAGASRIFTASYSASVSRALVPLLQNDRLLVRVAAMLVARHLSDVGAVALLTTALKDSSPAVRYLVGQAVTALADKVPPDAQRKLLEGLSAAFAAETDQIVVEQLLAGLGSLRIEEARQSMLDGLNRRVDVHRKNSNLPLRADHEGLARLFNRTVTDAAGGQKPAAAFLRQLTSVITRYLNLCATGLDEGKVHRTLVPQYQRVLIDGSTMLRWIAEKAMNVPADQLPRDDVKDNTQGQRWQEVRLRIEEWKRALRNPPFNLTPGQLE